MYSGILHTSQTPDLLRYSYEVQNMSSWPIIRFGILNYCSSKKFKSLYGQGCCVLLTHQSVSHLESVSMKLKALWSQRSRKALYRKQKAGFRNTAPETMKKVAHVQG